MGRYGDEDRMYASIENQYSSGMITRQNRARDNQLIVQIHSDSLNMGQVMDSASEVEDVIRDRRDESEYFDEDLSEVWSMVTEVEGHFSGQNLRDYVVAEVPIWFEDKISYSKMKLIAEDIQSSLEANFDYFDVTVEIDDDPWEMYYCEKCEHKHQQTSKIGKKHMKYKR